MAKGYTDFIGGMITGAATPTAPGGIKYTDWEKAERICQEHPDCTITAGLREDWNNTSGVIFDHGRWCNGGWLYDQSRWATPVVDIDGEEIECWTHEKHTNTGVPKWWGRGEKLHRG